MYQIQCLLGGKFGWGNKIVVPPTMLLPVLKYLHSLSHTEKRKFVEIFSRTFSWKGERAVLQSAIDRVGSSCQLCHSLRRQTGKKQDTLTHYPVPENIFSSICIDFYEMPTVKVEGGDHIRLHDGHSMPTQRLYYGHPHSQKGAKRRKSSKPLSAELRTYFWASL